MSETEALLRLYGAIDRAVVAGKIKSSHLAQFFDAYRDGRASGWYDGQYLPWVEMVHDRAKLRREVDRPKETRARAGARRMPIERPIRLDREPAQEISEALSAFPSDLLEGRAAARRLLAATIVAQALPEVFGARGSQAADVNRMLVFHREGRDDDGLALQRATDLHHHFAENFRKMSDWHEVIEGAYAADMISESFRSQSVMPPCIGKLMMLPDPTGADPDPCTVLEAEFTTSSASFEDLKRFLEPENWQYEGSFWCQMERAESLGTNSWRYHETVSTDCGSPGAWSVSTDLQFWFSHPTPTEARAEYDFPPGLPTPLSDINVDEGSLRVIKLSDTSVNVKTTKRVRFSGPLDGAGLAMFMCATGYSQAVEDLVFTVAADPLKPLKPFPVPAPQGAAAPTTPQGGVVPPTNPNPESLDDIISEAAQLVTASLKKVSDTCTSSMKSVEDGTYKVENAWADGMTLWSTWVSGMSKALDLGTRTAKVLANKPDDET